MCRPAGWQRARRQCSTHLPPTPWAAPAVSCCWWRVHGTRTWQRQLLAWRQRWSAWETAWLCRWPFSASQVCRVRHARSS